MSNRAGGSADNTASPASKDGRTTRIKTMSGAVNAAPVRSRQEVLNKYQNPGWIGKDIKKKRTSLSESNVSDSSFVDVEDIVSPKIARKYDSLKCPCNESDTSSTYVVCVKCAQSWHQKCCNLHGVSVAAIKKLEKWECPRCYVSPLVPKAKPESEASSYRDFLDNMKRIEECNKELNSSITAVEFFNLHIKHLLIDDTKFKERTTQIESLSTNFREMKQQFSELHNITCSSDEDISSQLAALTRQVTELADTPINCNAATTQQTLSAYKINDLEEHILKLSEKIDMFEKNIGSMNVQDRISNVLDDQESDSDSMGPNTTSPHVTQGDPPCDPYNTYAENVIPADLKARLITYLEENSNDFKSEGNTQSRDVMYFGEYGYWYTGGRHEAARTPKILEELFDSVRNQKSDPSSWTNSCLVTRYSTGKNTIPFHRDDELFLDPESEIVTVSLGAKRTIKFIDNTTTRVKELEVGDCSVYTMSRYSQDYWKHGIEEEDTILETRYSFTFRHVAPHFANSTVLIGDSNTKYAKFGYEKGQFGRWLPGKRIESNKVEEIPKPQDIGPYRNYVIHTGVNNIRFNDNRKSNKALVNELQQKCLDILEVYPRSKIYISLLLPTKVRSLNKVISDINNRILDMTYKHRKISVLEHSTLADSNGSLIDDFGRFTDGRPNPQDVIHLGKAGIRILCSNIKKTIIKRKSGNIARPRFNVGSGSYRDALGRGTHHDGYQSV